MVLFLYLIKLTRYILSSLFIAGDCTEITGSGIRVNCDSFTITIFVNVVLLFGCLFHQ